MKASLKRKWVEALRSGKYQQGTCRLRTRENGYCCLGVLAKVVTGRAPKAEAACYYGASQGLITDAQETRLANFNDGFERKNGTYADPKTFKQIAAYIERYV
jgi:hypothetical protein